MIATIDIGSNSVLLLIAKKNNGKLEVLVDEARVTSLGRGLDKTGNFHLDSMKETRQVLKEYIKILSRYSIQPQDVLVTATEASRKAANSRDFFSEIKKELQVNVCIISDYAESYLTAMGVVTDGEANFNDPLVIMDIGGSSTELIKVKKNRKKIDMQVSLPVGAVRASEWLESASFDQKFQEALGAYKLEDFKTEKLVCVAGSMTSLGAMMKGLSAFNGEDICGVEITVSEFLLFYNKIKQLTVAQLQEHYPFLGKRSQSIVAGLKVAKEISHRLSVDSFVISTRGLRHGLAHEQSIHPNFILKD